MENMVNKTFWHGKNVFITGHTGFKGSWLTLVLKALGANVFGYALAPNTDPSLFDLLQLDAQMDAHQIDDIRDLNAIKKAVADAKPDIIFHLAAQPLVRYSYDFPVETYETNVMGVVNILEAFKASETSAVLVNVTTDKCYKNREWCWGYREDEPLGGYDPYSSSKACAELVTEAFSQSFFNIADHKVHGKVIASARAGNVIGGGDWNQDRLIPDIVQSVLQDKPLLLRSPNAIRPWQHVLEPVSAYLKLAESLWKDPATFGGAWNFGPSDDDCISVQEIAEGLATRFGKTIQYAQSDQAHVHEATFLKLDISKAKSQLSWQPKWCIQQTLDQVAQWYQGWQNRENLMDLTNQQISEFFNL